MLKQVFIFISIPLFLGGCLSLEHVDVSLAENLNGTLGIPVNCDFWKETSALSPEVIRFIVVVTNEREKPIYFYSPHHSQGKDVVTFEINDNLSSRHIDRQCAWIRNLPNQIFVLQPKESAFFPITLPSKEWENLSCAPVDRLRALFTYSTDETMEVQHTSISGWYKAKALLFGLPQALETLSEDSLDSDLLKDDFE